MFVKRNDMSYKKICIFQVIDVQAKVIFHYDSLFGGLLGTTRVNLSLTNINICTSICIGYNMLHEV